ncbi:MAG: TolC family protein [Acidobacteria bacterium]|nr:TolC family protein [Acidobacteriota bacterium]
MKHIFGNAKIVLSGMKSWVRWRPVLAIALLCLAAVESRAEQTLSLEEALRIALDQNPALLASEAAIRGAQERVSQARARFLPTVNYSESFQWGTNPVYVFGSLLEQHRFTSSNFDIVSLNRPDPLTNFASQLTAEQVLFDGNQIHHRVHAARVATDMTREQKRQAEMDILKAVLEAYFGVVLAQENVRLAEEMLATTQADLERAEALRDAEMTTDSDVLALRVQRASIQEQRIRAENSQLVAEARLNQLLGQPLETQYVLSTPLQSAPAVTATLSELESTALQQRPESHQSEMALALAETEWDSTRSSFLPQVALQGSFEVNRQAFITRGGSNWMAGVTLNWNLFRGFADRARVAEMAALKTQREQEQRGVASSMRFDVRRSYLDLQAANRRIDVAEAAVAQAEESHRIFANRYEAGLANVTEMLRSETALSEAKTRLLAAIFDQRVATAHLERATGTLSPNSLAVMP